VESKSRNFPQDFVTDLEQNLECGTLEFESWNVQRPVTVKRFRHAIGQPPN
jgi:hypothetical protein